MTRIWGGTAVERLADGMRGHVLRACRGAPLTRGADYVVVTDADRLEVWAGVEFITAEEALRHTRSEPIFRAALDAARADVRAAALFRSTPVSILRARDDGVLIVVEEALSSLPLFDPARAGDGEAETAERPMIAGA